MTDRLKYVFYGDKMNLKIEKILVKYQISYFLLNVRWIFDVLLLSLSCLINLLSFVLFKYPFTMFLIDMNSLGTDFNCCFVWFNLLLKNYNTSDTCSNVYSFESPLNDINPIHTLSSPFKNINTLPIFLFISKEIFSNLQRWKNVCILSYFREGCDKNGT